MGLLAKCQEKRALQRKGPTIMERRYDTYHILNRTSQSISHLLVMSIGVRRGLSFFSRRHVHSRRHASLSAFLWTTNPC
jgi:hypothetical protein